MARNIMLGTDWWTDCDDIAAVRILCHGIKTDIWNVSGIVINACMRYSAISLSAFLTYEEIAPIEIGIDHNATDFGGNPPYQAPFAEYPHYINSNDECLDGVELYRNLLTRSEDNSVELIEIGYPQVIANLLLSDGGIELVAKKVKKLWMMAGNWQNDGRGFENNITRAKRSREGATIVFDKFPCPICLLGWEVGSSVIVGDGCSEDDLLTVGFKAHKSINGRSAWDPMLVLLALENDFGTAGYTARYGKASANITDGENRFAYDSNGNHCYVVKNREDDWYRNKINKILRSKNI